MYRLHIPDGFYRYNFLAVDPGSMYTGVAVYTVRACDGAVERIEPIEVALGINDPVWGVIKEDYRDLDIRLMRWQGVFIDLLARYKPVMVVYETPFFNPRTPNSFRALTEQMSLTKHTLYNYNPNIPFIGLAPMEVKAALRSTTIKGKEVILKGLQAKPEITSVMTRDLSELDDNAVDAVAVGYAMNIRRERLWY